MCAFEYPWSFDLAYLEKVTMSSATHEQYHTGMSVDGNLDKKWSFSITEREGVQWWKVDFGAPYHICRVIVYNREPELGKYLLY